MEPSTRIGRIADRVPRFARGPLIPEAAILVALRKRNSAAVVGEGAPARWRLKEATDRSENRTEN
jgi:hypothetical protein